MTNEASNTAREFATEIDELAAANEEQTAEVTEISQLVDAFSDDWEAEFEASR